MSDESLEVMVARIDERTTHLMAKADNYVTKEEFGPVRAAVFGVATAIILGLIGAAVTWIVKGGMAA